MTRKILVADLLWQRLEFDRPKLTGQRSVVGFAISARVNTSVAIRTEGDDEARIIRPAIADPANVVRFQVGRAIRPRERCRRRAPLATLARTREYIAAHIVAPLVNRTGRRCTWCRDFSSRHRRRSQCLQRRARCYLGVIFEIDLDIHRLERTELKDEGSTHGTSSVRSLTLNHPLADPFPVVAEPAAALHPKQEQAFTVRCVVRDCPVATGHLHVADLAFAEILEDTVRSQPVAIAMLLPLFTGDDDYEWVLAGSDYSSPLLAGEAGVNVFLSIVSPAAFKRPFGQLHACDSQRRFWQAYQPTYVSVVQKQPRRCNRIAVASRTASGTADGSSHD